MFAIVGMRAAVDDHLCALVRILTAQVGDALLRFVGALLRGSIRPTDQAVRFGGDEFLILLPDTTGHEAVSFADRIVKMFGQYTSRLGRDRFLSMSAGVASVPGDECKDGHELIAQADRALYVAKRGGKNTVARQKSGGKPAAPAPLADGAGQTADSPAIARPP